MMNSLFIMMNSVSKMMNYVFKMMIYSRLLLGSNGGYIMRGTQRREMGSDC